MALSVAVTGSTGLVGGALALALGSAGHRVVRVVRGAAAAAGDGAVRWDPDFGTIEASRLDGVDAVVHLSGESIARGRWTEAKKQRIRSSRVRSTIFLADTLARLPRPPRALVAASATGYYGSRGDQVLLASTRAVPARLEATGFAFGDPALEGALRRLLSR